MSLFIYFLLFIVFIIYSIGSAIAYNDSIRNSPWLYVYALIISTVGSLLWITIVKIVDQKEKIYVVGVWWDVIVALAYTIVPIIFFHLKFGPMAWMGVILIMAGLLLLKRGS